MVFIEWIHDYVMNIAKLAFKGGVKHYNYVGSRLAKKDSYFLLPKVKVSVRLYIRFLLVLMCLFFSKIIPLKKDKLLLWGNW